MALHVISENRFMDGRVVYLTRNADWTECINCVLVSQDKPDLAAAIELGGQAEVANVVGGVYEDKFHAAA